MKQISAECIEMTGRAIHEITDEEVILNLSERFSQDQPALSNFILEFTQEMSNDACELAYSMGLIIWQCYLKTFSGKVGSIDLVMVMQEFRKLEEQLKNSDSENADERDEVLFPSSYSQPEILRYLVEGVFESDRAGIELTSGEEGELFLILRVVADCFSLAVDRP